MGTKSGIKSTGLNAYATTHATKSFAYQGVFGWRAAKYRACISDFKPRARCLSFSISDTVVQYIQSSRLVHSCSDRCRMDGYALKRARRCSPALASSSFRKANLPSNQQPKKMQKSTSPNAIWTYPIAGVATTAAKQVCIYESAQQAFPAAAMRALNVMTAAMRARIHHSDRPLSHGIVGP